MIRQCFSSRPGPVDVEFSDNISGICGGIAPHAGYVFSGPVAAYLYKALGRVMFDTVIILGPNHTGLGPGASVFYPEGVWETPLGELKVDGDIAQFFAESGLELDGTAHQYEHSIEVQLPFLQYLFEDRPKIVPVCYLDQSYQTAVNIAEVLKNAVERFSDRRIFILVSTDLNHFGGHFGVSEPEGTGLNQYLTECDAEIIERIINLDGKGLMNKLEDGHYTMCGYGPVVSAIEYAHLTGRTGSVKLNYNNSLHYMQSDSAVGYLAHYFY